MLLNDLPVPIFDAIMGFLLVSGNQLEASIKIRRGGEGGGGAGEGERERKRERHTAEEVEIE